MLKKYHLYLITLVLILASGLIASQVLDNYGRDYTDDALQRSLLTFGVARALNGVISVAQGTEVAVQPAGLGVTFTPGEILDPINDLVERFSWVMLLSSASIGIQKTLLTIGAWSVFSWATIALLLSAAITLWLPQLRGHSTQGVLLKLALLALVLRLAVPTIAIINEAVYQQFLAQQYDEASVQLQQTTDNIGRINQRNLVSQYSNQTGSIWDAAKQFYNSAVEQVDIDAQLEQYKQATAEASLQLVNLIVVFLLQTVLLPLAFLAGLYWLLKYLVNTSMLNGD